MKDIYENLKVRGCVPLLHDIEHQMDNAAHRGLFYVGILLHNTHYDDMELTEYSKDSLKLFLELKGYTVNLTENRRFIEIYWE